MADRPSLSGQRAYLSALNKHWPELLESLKSDVAPTYRTPWDTNADGVKSGIRETWHLLRSNPRRIGLLRVMEQWADRFRITETWILDSALDTLFIYCPENRIPGMIGAWTFWRLLPNGPQAHFEPRLQKSHWYPSPNAWPGESWDSFKKRMESQFRTQLAEYRRVVEDRFGTGKEMIPRDAEWTVRYQRGESAIEIAESADLIGYEDPEQAVFKAISKFARSIHLNLRRRGERPRKPSVPYQRPK